MDAKELLAAWGMDNKAHGICGCGNPEQMYEDIHAMLTFSHRIFEEGRDFKTEIAPIYEDRTARFGERYEQFMLHVLNDWGLLEHGTGIGSSWLTSLGEAVRLAFDELGEVGYEEAVGAGLSTEDYDRIQAEYEAVKDAHGRENAAKLISFGPLVVSDKPRQGTVTLSADPAGGDDG